MVACYNMLGCGVHDLMCLDSVTTDKLMRVGPAFVSEWKCNIITVRPVVTGAS